MNHFLAPDGLPLSLGSLKRAEDGEGLILRLYEPHGNRGRALLRFPMPLNRIERVNLLEEAGRGSRSGAPTTGQPSTSTCARLKSFRCALSSRPSTVVDRECRPGIGPDRSPSNPR